ncbi:MAG TPA: hypothetical protein VGK73_40175 [Polyangiaceae bacterium]
MSCRKCSARARHVRGGAEEFAGAEEFGEFEQSGEFEVFAEDEDFSEAEDFGEDEALHEAGDASELEDFGERHARGALPAFSAGRPPRTFDAFDTYEHASLGTSADLGIQAMVDTWALGGLVDGGAFIDTGTLPATASKAAEPAKPIAEWRIHVPQTVPLGSAASPYAGQRLSPRARWHWIAPDPVFRRPGERWTAETLRAALASGEALAVNLGQIIFLAGDLVPSFIALKQPKAFALGVMPTGTMLGYGAFDPYAWEFLSQLGPFPHREEEWYRPGSLEALEALRQPRALENAGRYDAQRAKLKSSSRPGWAAALLREVELLRKLRGPSGFSELHVLAQTLWLPDTLKSHQIIPQAPWLDLASKTRLLAPTRRYDDRFFQDVITNGRFFSLALDNGEHFYPRNWNTFERDARAALLAVHDHILAKRSPHPIPADAIAQLAFALHYLTDAFSAGHMRTPRDRLGQQGGMAAKVMHDIDGRLGLTVTNGFAQKWRAFGDGHLVTPHELGAEALRRLRGLLGMNTAPDANLRAVRAAVSAAFKQLHYHAQHQRSHAGTDHVRPTLDANRGAVKDRLAGDEKAPDGRPGLGAGVSDWIAMNLDQRLKYLRMHEPRPLPEGTRWDARLENHPRLLDDFGNVGAAAKKAYRWAKDWSSANNNRRLKLRFSSFPAVEFDAYDATQLYQLTINRPNGAFWAPRETKLLELFQRIPEDKWD